MSKNKHDELNQIHKTLLKTPTISSIAFHQKTNAKQIGYIEIKGKTRTFVEAIPLVWVFLVVGVWFPCLCEPIILTDFHIRIVNNVFLFVVIMYNICSHQVGEKKTVF